MQMTDRIIAAIRHLVFMARGEKARIEDKLETALDGPLSKEEVDAVLAAALKERPQFKNYDKSIVDLLGLLNLPFSASARKKLAAEHGISDYSGTAEQNITLHQKVMEQVANREFNK